jgi:hypothetical protein
MTIHIYGLLDPRNGVVRYVGQCENLKTRYTLHLSQAMRGDKPQSAWIRKLAPEKPVLVHLESVEQKRLRLPGSCRSVRLSSIIEAKWLKRFRRTVLNLNKRQCNAYDEFVNSPELQTRYGLSQ